MLTRRSLLAGFGALVAAPAVITTPGLLMPVRTIAVAPWVLDPVAMATRCVATTGGIDHFSPAEWRHPRTGKVHRYMRPVSRPLQDDEARARVQAYIDRPSDQEVYRRAAQESLANESRYEADRLKRLAEWRASKGTFFVDIGRSAAA